MLTYCNTNSKGTVLLSDICTQL